MRRKCATYRSSAHFRTRSSRCGLLFLQIVVHGRSLTTGRLPSRRIPTAHDDAGYPTIKQVSISGTLRPCSLGVGPTARPASGQPAELPDRPGRRRRNPARPMWPGTTLRPRNACRPPATKGTSRGVAAESVAELYARAVFGWSSPVVTRPRDRHLPPGKPYSSDHVTIRRAAIRNDEQKQHHRDADTLTSWLARTLQDRVGCSVCRRKCLAYEDSELGEGSGSANRRHFHVRASYCRLSRCPLTVRWRHVGARLLADLADRTTLTAGFDARGLKYGTCTQGRGDSQAGCRSFNGTAG